jgi:signal transduction histidine kinase
VAEVFTERIRNHQQHLVLEISEDLPPLVSDFNYLELILSELLHNACKYTPAGEAIHLSASVLSSDSTGADWARSSCLSIAVRNSGVEIPPEELDHVFDKFYRVPNNDPWKHGGTGLGLALVKKRVERLGGSITVFCENNWTSFLIQLPWNLG